MQRGGGQNNKRRKLLNVALLVDNTYYKYYTYKYDLESRKNVENSTIFFNTKLDTNIANSESILGRNMDE